MIEPTIQLKDYTVASQWNKLNKDVKKYNQSNQTLYCTLGGKNKTIKLTNHQYNHQYNRDHRGRLCLFLRRDVTKRSNAKASLGARAWSSSAGPSKVSEGRGEPTRTSAWSSVNV
jgi:hypothetical protein